MKISYKHRLFFYFFLIFLIFTAGIAIFEYNREKSLKTRALEEKLDSYVEMINASMRQSSENNYTKIDTLTHILPQNLRITIISADGTVAYDNSIKENIAMENHGSRPEIEKAKESGIGTDIRMSNTNHRKYLYYTRQIGNYFIRVALPYNVKVENFIKTDNMFLYFIIGFFLFALLFIKIVANRFDSSIQKLKDFVLSESNNISNSKIDFPEDELGVIGRKIMENHQQIKNKQQELYLEKEKLLQHVHSSGEGLCFFSPQKKIEFYNGLFIQYINTISNSSTSEPSIVFEDKAFENIMKFISSPQEIDYYETQISRQGKIFNVRANIFEDKSFEIIINDISTQEKTRLLKQEMTSNIAHELRTPVTSIRGFLEIALENDPKEEDAKTFLTKAYRQTVLLSELIRDMSLITKMEESPASFEQETIDLEQLLTGLQADLSKQTEEKRISFNLINIENTSLSGSASLIYSIFRNLTDNVIRYAGSDVTITIKRYDEDKNFYYFSYSDNGAGIEDEQHLNRIFERFYRVNQGRTRQTGGSGLGLSIVKNAVLFHKGTIVAKNQEKGGLEFLFNLPKDVNPK